MMIINLYYCLRLLVYLLRNNNFNFTMAKKSMIARDKKRFKRVKDSLNAGVKPSFVCRVRRRCQVCGRPRGFIRFFSLCRICLRRFASEGLIPGLLKSSW
jgi:small subunit ribosomal protein S14